MDVDRLTREAKADPANIEEALRRQRQQHPPRYSFIYKVSIRNSGAKATKSPDRDQVFFDRETKK